MHSEDNTESHHILGPYHDFHNYSPSFRCIIQLHVSDLPDSRFYMYGFMESRNLLRVLCRTNLEGKRYRMSLRGLMVRGDATMWTWCQAHVNVMVEDYVDHVSRPSVRASIEGRFGISIRLY